MSWVCAGGRGSMTGAFNQPGEIKARFEPIHGISPARAAEEYRMRGIGTDGSQFP